MKSLSNKQWIAIQVTSAMGNTRLSRTLSDQRVWPLTLITALAVSYVSFKVYELPIIELGRRLTQERRA